MRLPTHYQKLFDCSNKLEELLFSVDPARWTENTLRQDLYRGSPTNSIIYIWTPNTDATYSELKQYITEDQFDDFDREVWRVANIIKNYYGGENTIIPKLMVVKLFANSKLATHVDPGNLKDIHRCHLPIQTNSQCFFVAEDTPYHFKPFEVVEVNNRVYHHAINNSDQDRIHLICDVLVR